MAERRSSVRKATQRSKGEATPNYNLVAQFTNQFQKVPTPAARRGSSANDASNTTPPASRKRSLGAGALVTKSESNPGELIEGLSASGAIPSAIHANQADQVEDSDLSELGTTPGCLTAVNHQHRHQGTPDLTTQLDVVAKQLVENVSASDHEPASPTSDHADPDSLLAKPADSSTSAPPMSSPISPQDTAQISMTENTMDTPHEADIMAMASGTEPSPVTGSIPSGSQKLKLVLTRQPSNVSTARVLQSH